VPLLAEVLEDARFLDFPFELLQRPIEAISFVEGDFNHEILAWEVCGESKQKSRADAIGPAPHFTGNCRSRKRV